jgi:hypothetical protein
MRTFYISVFKGFLVMKIYKWQQDMFRMFPSKRTELLKIVGSTFVRLVSGAMKSLYGYDTPGETDKNRRQNPSKILQIIAIQGRF